METRVKRICPRCNKEFTEHPALSRVDDKTLLCPLCGTREALEASNMSEEEIEKIIDLIKKSSQ